MSVKINTTDGTFQYIGQHSCFVLLTLCSSVSTKWVRHVARMGVRRNKCKILGRKRELKKPFGKPKRKWEVDINVDLRKIGLECVDWILLAQDWD